MTKKFDHNHVPEFRGECFGADLRSYEYEHNGEIRTNTVVDVFVEDDGFWHHTMTFSKHWLTDLTNILDTLY